MSQTAANVDVDATPVVTPSSHASKPRESKTAKKTRVRRSRFEGEVMVSLTMRLPERERALCFADATDCVRSINSHVAFRLKHAVSENKGAISSEDVGAFIDAHGHGLGERFVIRVPMWLANEVRALANRENITMNVLVRYALFGYPAPPSDMLPYKVRVFRGPSQNLTKENPTRGAKHSTYSGTPLQGYRSFRLPVALLTEFEKTADMLDRSVNGQMIVATRNCLSLFKGKQITVSDLLSHESSAMASPMSVEPVQLRDQQPVLDALDLVVKRTKKPIPVVMSCILERYLERCGVRDVPGLGKRDTFL